MMRINKANIENLKDEIIDLLHENEMWLDVSIYCNGKCWSTSDKECKHFRYGGEPFVYEADPHDYTEYAGDILTMTFEGPLYDALNYGFRFEDKLLSLFKKYGLYYEMGHAWDLTACEM